MPDDRYLNMLLVMQGWNMMPRKVWSTTIDGPFASLKLAKAEWLKYIPVGSSSLKISSFDMGGY